MLKNRVFYPLLAGAILIFGFALLKMAMHTPSEVKKIYHTTTPDAETFINPNTKTQGKPAPHADTAPMDINSIESLVGGNKDFLEILKSLKGYNKSWSEVVDPNLPGTHPFNVEARHKASLANFISRATPDELADPRFQKAIEIQLSQPYINLVNNGANADELFNFQLGEFEKLMGRDGSHIRNPNQRYFRKYFPTGTHEDYEPEMRARLTTLIEKNGGYSSEILSEFMQDKRAGVWFYTRGLKYESKRDVDESVNVDWIRDVKANAMGLTKVEAIDMDVEVPIPEGLPLSEFDTTDAGSEQQPPSEDPILNVRKAVPDNPDTQSQPTKPSLPKPPTMPSASQLLATDAEVEVSLREYFSPRRFNKAISTLDQYGPEEGLRRIKESDPEVGKHIERFIRPKQGQTGDK
ncbi:MAG: hypothetical protein OXU36_08255 [Candidatus Poribacteria bacterium]|nr:hypothetical protein [Candidatus Poribacteria bacterium]